MAKSIQTNNKISSKISKNRKPAKEPVGPLVGLISLVQVSLLTPWTEDRCNISRVVELT